MCGIIGCIGNYARGSIDLRPLKHRGPDDEGIFEAERICLGHVRLSIIDITTGGHQPLISSDEQWILVFNGEIYNYKALRLQLERDHQQHFHTASDTEVLMKAWQIWGTHTPNLLEGMFAFAIYHKSTHQLWLVRDRMGIKPLYYFEGRDAFYFGSELRALMNWTGIRKGNEATLPDLLQLQTVPFEPTLLERYSMVPSGTILHYKEGEITANTYWSLGKQFNTAIGTGSKDQLRETIIEAVEERLVADVPLGAFLSGGIDSSLVCGIIREELQKPLSTFTVAFDYPEFKDGPFAKQVAQKLGTDHHEIKLTEEQILESVIEGLDAVDHPSADGINTYIVSKAVRKEGIKVALSGLGGDEVFGGYSTFARMRKWARIMSLFKLLAPFITTKIGGDPFGRLSRMLQMIKYPDLPHAYSSTRTFIPDQVVNTLLKNVECHHNAYDLALAGQRYATVDDFTSFAELSCYMQNVLLRDTDQMSMAVGLEVRVPLIDRKVIEAALGLSASDRIDKAQPKGLLGSLFPNILTADLMTRPKQGFVMPWDQWLRGPLASLVHQNFAFGKTLDTVFDPEVLSQLEQDYFNRRTAISWSRIWLLTSFFYWVNKNKITW